MTQAQNTQFIGVSEESRPLLECVNPRFIQEGLLSAQERSWKVLHEVKSRICEGMTEDDARVLALKIFENHGVSKHWHKPYIRLGPGTLKTFHQPLQPDYRLKQGDPFYVDLGPVWPGLGQDTLSYEGDVGDTFVLGSNAAAEKCIETARRLFKETEAAWREKRLTGEGLYSFLKERVSQTPYQLLENVDGHRVADFPHQKYSRERLAKLKFAPSEVLWVLEVQLIDEVAHFGAFFEDILRI